MAEPSRLILQGVEERGSAEGRGWQEVPHEGVTSATGWVSTGRGGIGELS